VKKEKLIKSFAMQDRAKLVIPGMSQFLSKRPDMWSIGVWPTYYSKAKGDLVWDLDGNKYIDMSVAGVGTNILGYADTDVNEAVKRVLMDGTSSTLLGPEEVELSELMIELHPWAQMARLTRTGAEAMAVAVRLSRAYTGREVIAFCGYHGWMDWYLAANLESKEALGGHLLPGLNPAGIPKGLIGTSVPFNYNNLEELKTIVSKYGKDLAAIVMEPIRNIYPEQGFLEGVRGLADETGAVLVFDEITAGFRLASAGSHTVICEVSPDIATFSKAIGNGHPIAVIIGRENVMQVAQDTFMSSTFWSERVGPAAALAVIEKHRRLDVAKRLDELGQKVIKTWDQAAQKHGLKIIIGGLPPLCNFMIQGTDMLTIKAYYIQLMLEQGFLASNAYTATYAHTNEHLDSFAKAVDIAFSEISQAINEGSVIERLKGKPTSPGFKRLA